MILLVDPADKRSEVGGPSEGPATSAENLIQAARGAVALIRSPSFPST